MSYELTPEMERATLRQIISDPLVLPRLAKHLRADGFDDESVRLAVSSAISYFSSFAEAPTAAAILQEVRDGVAKGKWKTDRVRAVGEAIEAAREGDVVASEYVVRKILTAERDRALGSALDRASKMFAEGRRDDIAAEIERASSIGRSTTAMGQFHVEGLAKRTEDRLKYKMPQRWGTGIVELDDITDGGLSHDNPLGCFLAPPKGGKSIALDQCALHHQEIGGFAFYASFENGENEVLLRHDAAISMVPINQVYTRAREVEAKVRAFTDRTRGGMHVKKFPGGRQTSCRDLDVYLQELRASYSIRPTLIVFDYWDEMAANDPAKYDKRHEELEAIGQEMRALLEKHRCVGWTASRVTKASIEKKGIDIGDVAGAFSKANVVDLMVAILRSEEEKHDEKVRFAVLASRFSRDASPTGALPSAFSCGRIVVQRAIDEETSSS